jgi:3',5'-cyclic-AMP phosphodiesterase
MTPTCAERTLKIGLVSDIHLGPDRETRRGSDAQRLVEEFLSDMRRFDPAFIVDLGDRIMEVDEPTDRRHTLLVRDLLRRAGVPVHHLLGNHDVAHLSKDDVCRLLGLPGAYGAIDVQGYRCLFLDSTDPVVGEYGGHISAAQRAWLQGALAGSPYPVIVFCHHPLDDQSMAGNVLFTAHPEWALTENRVEVRQVLAGSRRVAAVLSGHVHWNRTSVVEGTPYFTIQGLVETWTTNGAPAGAYGKLWIEPGGAARLVVEGRDPLVVETARVPSGDLPHADAGSPVVTIETASTRRGKRA